MSKAVFPRKVYHKINQLLQQHSIVLLFGVLGSGKSNFLKAHFSAYNYLSLKNKTYRKLLEEDPYRFFNLHLGKTIFDDIEEVDSFQELVTSYSLSIYQSGNYILVSNIRPEKTHELVAVCPFFPMDLQEMKNARKFALTLEGNCLQTSIPGAASYKKYLDELFSGPFARLVRIQNRELLFDLVKACAEQADQPVNLNAIAKKLGVSQPTVQNWLQALDKCGLVHFLHPLDQAFNKRILKSPKLYFCDSGLLCYLLKIKSPEELLQSPHFMAIYRNLVFLELYRKNEADTHPKILRYWRESNGHEIPFLFENPTSYDIYDCVSAHEVTKQHFRELDLFDEISEGRVLSRNIIYGGYKTLTKQEVKLISWQAI